MKKTPFKIEKGSVLIVEILQNGVVQKRKKFNLGRIFKKNIYFGKGRGFDFSFLGTKVPKKICLFKFGRNESVVHLPSYVNGFLFNGEIHGKIDDFRKVLMATAGKKISIPLKNLSRGLISVNEYAVIFKIIKPKIAQKKKNIRVPGAGITLLNWSQNKVAIEKISPFLSLSLSALSMLLMMFFLKSSRVPAPKSLLSLPKNIQIGMLSPEHLSAQPIIYRDKFDSSKIIEQTYRWADEFMKRENSFESGLPYRSSIEILNDGIGVKDLKSEVGKFKEDILEKRKEFLQAKTNSRTARYFSFLKTNSGLETQVSGGLKGSIYLQEKRRIRQITKLYELMNERYQNEFAVLNEYYKKYELKFNDPSQKPEFGRIKEALLGKAAGIRFVEEFENERAGLVAANLLAAQAKNSDLKRHNEVFENKLLAFADYKASTVFLSSKSLVDGNVHLPNGYLNSEGLFENAKLSLDPSLVPTPPPLRASIDMRAVHQTIYAKREQVRACYESALRRNSALSGRIELGWTVALNGRVGRVIVKKSTMHDNAFEVCLKNRLQTWNFPKPKNGEVFVSYPFEFDISSE